MGVEKMPLGKWQQRRSKIPTSVHSMYSNLC